MKNKKFEVKLMCVNCGWVANYAIPLRRIFQGYVPPTTVYGVDGTEGESIEEGWSGYFTPNRNRFDLMLCNRCRVPMLIRLPMPVIEALGGDDLVKV